MAGFQHLQLAYNNVYVVDRDDTRVLVDTGPDYAGAAAAIDSSLGGKLPSVAIATHGHLDHAGLGKHWQQRGVAVALGAADIHLAQDPQLADPAELTWFEEFLRDTGTPAAIAAEVQSGLKRRRAWALEAARDQPHRPGGDGRWPTQLRYRHFKPDRVLFDGDHIVGTKLQVIHCPGHTPGNIVLYEADEGWLFSGDQLLPEITPTPAVQIAPEPGPSGHWRFASLPRFLDSMHRIRDLALTRCWPGHGAPFDNVREVIDENIAQIEQRTEKVLAAIHRHGEATVYDLASDLYPRALKRRYWQIVATIQGHLDILVERELVTTSAGKYVRL